MVTWQAHVIHPQGKPHRESPMEPAGFIFTLVHSLCVVIAESLKQT